MAEAKDAASVVVDRMAFPTSATLNSASAATGFTAAGLAGSSSHLTTASKQVTDRLHCMDDACSSPTSQSPDACKVVAVRRYCLIYGEHVPDEYFKGGLQSDACVALQTAIAQLTAQLVASGRELVLHEYAQGVPAFNLHADDGELWCNIPEAGVVDVLQSLGDRVDDAFEECGCPS